MRDELLACVIPQNFVSDQLGILGVFIECEVAFI